MNVSGLVATLESEGMVLTVSGSELRVTARPGVVSADKLNQVRQYKPKIVAYLSERDSASTEETSGWTVRETATHTVYESPGCPDYDTIDWDSPLTTKRLIGCGFPSRATKRPPACILVDPAVICPSCNGSRVLPELTSMTRGLCWECHATASQRSKGTELVTS